MIRYLKIFHWRKVALTAYTLAFAVLITHLNFYTCWEMFKITFVASFLAIPLVIVVFRKYART